MKDALGEGQRRTVEWGWAPGVGIALASREINTATEQLVNHAAVRRTLEVELLRTADTSGAGTDQILPMTTRHLRGPPGAGRERSHTAGVDRISCPRGRRSPWTATVPSHLMIQMMKTILTRNWLRCLRKRDVFFMRNAHGECKQRKTKSQRSIPYAKGAFNKDTTTRQLH